MRSQTLIGGTAYNVIKGLARVAGTQYSIFLGKIRISGVESVVPVGKPRTWVALEGLRYPFYVTLTPLGQRPTGIDSDGRYRVLSGSEIECTSLAGGEQSQVVYYRNGVLQGQMRVFTFNAQKDTVTIRWYYDVIGRAACDITET